MEDSILKSTKNILGLSSEYTVFDLDIITFINSAFSNLDQLGVTVANGFAISDEVSKWSDLNLNVNQLSMVKSFILLKAKLLFDPPSTSFHITSIENQIKELEWRISTNREWDLDPNDPLVSEEV